MTDAKDPRDRLPSRAAGVGTFAWGGAAGAYFFCDPVNQLTMVMLTQVSDLPATIVAATLSTRTIRQASRVPTIATIEKPIIGQVLQYSLGCPTLRPELCRMCYSLFPDLRAAQEAAEQRDGGGSNEALSGFTG